MTAHPTQAALNILLVSTSYPKTSKDWQGRFIADMVQALSTLPDIRLSVWAPPGQLPQHVHYAASDSESIWLERMTAAGGIAQILRHSRLTGLGYALGLLRRLHRIYRASSNLDVAHVNWLQNALSLLGSDTPAVIGILGSDFGLLRLPGMISLLRLVIKQRKCILAPNAEWMAPKLREYFGDIAEIRPIPFGVEKNWFELTRPGYETGKQKWLAITRLTHNKLGDLLEWGEGMFDAERELHLFGPMQEKITLPPWIHYHGPTNPSELQQTWFPSAAGLITLSRHDEGRPQVILEAMASGLPVIASGLPAHRDLIKDRKTGLLVTSREGLQSALDFLASNDNNRQIGMAAKAWVRSEIGTWDDCASRYRKAYADLAVKKMADSN